MRILLLFLLVFVSHNSFAVWSQVITFATAAECNSALVNTYNRLDPATPYKCVGSTAYKDTTCPGGKLWDLASQTCADSCGTGTISGFTSAGQGFVACISNCQVTQIGNAVCQGTGTNPDSYCTADYQKTGKFCPTVSDQTQPCATCGSSSSSAPSSSSSVAASSTPASSSSAPTSSPSGASSSMAASSAASASTGANSSSGSGGSGGTGGTGGGDDGGGGDSGGGDSGGSTSSSGSGSGTGSGSVTGGGLCDEPPVCTGDVLQCNLILQTYKLRCTGKSLTARDTGEPTLDLEQKLADKKQEYATEFNALKAQLNTSLSLKIAGGSGALASNIQTIKGQQVELGIVARADFFSIIGALIMFAAAILSAYIILEK